MLSKVVSIFKFPIEFFRILCCFIIFSACSLADAQTKSIALTNTQGKTIDVYLLKVSETEVDVRLASNRKSHVLKLADLDKASQDKISKWKAAGGGLSTDFDIDFDSGRATRSLYEYSDTRTLTLKPVVTITNGDNNLETKPVKVTIFTLGRPTNDSSLLKVFQKENHALPSILGRGEHTIACKAYRTTYASQGYKYGNKYIGYVVLIHEENNVILAKSVPASLATKYGNQLLKLNENATYDKNLEVFEFAGF